MSPTRHDVAESGRAGAAPAPGPPEDRARPRGIDGSDVRARTPITEGAGAIGDWLYVPSGFWHVARAEED